VRLRGTVESPGEKHEAEKDAKRIPDTELVDNELQVRPLSDRKDAELRGRVPRRSRWTKSCLPRSMRSQGRSSHLTRHRQRARPARRSELVASNIAGAMRSSTR
jgi:hypothetical protein